MKAVSGDVLDVALAPHEAPWLGFGFGFGLGVGVRVIQGLRNP